MCTEIRNNILADLKGILARPRMYGHSAEGLEDVGWALMSALFATKNDNKVRASTDKFRKQRGYELSLGIAGNEREMAKAAGVAEDGLEDIEIAAVQAWIRYVMIDNDCNIDE